jgi:type I restriction enzyme R subunit
MIRTAGRDWNELHLVEDPAIELLRSLGYTNVLPEALEAERDSLKEVVLTKRLRAALTKLNPWLSDDNVSKAVRAVTTVPSTSLIEASEKLHTTLTMGVALEQDLGSGKKGQTVRFIDFEDPRANDLLVTRQYRLQGSKKQIVPDIIIFVNGIPLVVVEAKSPTLGEKWKQEAIEQMLRYQEIGTEYRELGMPKLFETVQVIVATCGQAAVYGTTTTAPRFYAEWKSAWPRTDAQLERDLGHSPTPQELLLHGLLTPEALLDVVRNFVVFERDSGTGRIVRKLCRYQQFAAVNKAIERARTAKRPEERGGVVWHTQGSGKSLTMLWLALKLRRDPTHENPMLVIVTDRIDLDQQIADTFVACGYPNPTRAESVKHLFELLSGPGGITVLATVQKFQELSHVADSKTRRVDRAEIRVLSEAKNIFVMTDEAHRTQYGGLAGNMRTALPNAAFFGFTGTPIDKQDRSTLSTFGPYIDTYTIEQAVADGATVPIFYEGRLPELRILGNSLDAVFDRVFADRTEEEREAIKKKYATEAAIAGAPKRVEAICLDLIDHFTKFIRPNGFKAQVVACSREVAATYKETLDRLNAPQSAIIMSYSNDDTTHLARYKTEKEERKTLIERFCRPSDPLSILVVCDMLLTGFDAPVEQVMYLDTPLKEHTLLQAIARVNRTADKKDYGLVVDYWGVSEALQEALAIFAPADVKGALTPKTDELPRLQARHAAALRFFVRVKDKDDLNACVIALAAEDVRAEFNDAFRRFAQSLDMMLPDPTALPYLGDARWLGKIRSAAAARFRDSTLDISDCGAKVKKLIEDAVVAEGIQILVQRVSLFTPEFEEKLQALKSDDAKASEMEHALKDEIHVKIDEDPAFYASLRERLEQIIEDRKAKRIDAAKQLELFQALAKDVKSHGEEAQKVGLSQTGFAIYGLLHGGGVLKVGEPLAPAYAPKQDEAKVALSSVLEEALAPQAAIVDWVNRDDVQREMRRLIKRQLRAADYPTDKVDALAEDIVDLLKRRHGR